ncbi:hypothetical protein [Halorarum salinum]|uniref:Uncharacterized protein n=1 Tax=Halorarum salinum TaxID=2743089 RepID=A0A7D5QB63_9EURY|nr:hypothetical protein [Halobaculum salinum]QLG63096.1 hypothetical protein HUG12_15690 [Halobaculum salinum]
MGYVFNCDGCGARKDHAPPFMGEFNETFLKTSAHGFAEEFSPGQTVTLCADCSMEVFLS